MEFNDGPLELLGLLEACNLMSYKDSLLEQGADDVDQLAGLSAKEFQQLCSMIGMDKKPFHVMRFKKALENLAQDENRALNITNGPSNVYKLKNLSPRAGNTSPGVPIVTPLVRGPPPLLKTCTDQQLNDGQLSNRRPDIHSQNLHTNHPQSQVVLVQRTPPVQTAILDPGYYSQPWKVSPSHSPSYYSYPNKQQAQPVGPPCNEVTQSHQQLPMRGPAQKIPKQQIVPLINRKQSFHQEPSFQCVQTRNTSVQLKTIHGPFLQSKDGCHVIPYGVPSFVSTQPCGVKPSSLVQTTPITTISQQGHISLSGSRKYPTPVIGKVQPIYCGNNTVKSAVARPYELKPTSPIIVPSHSTVPSNFTIAVDRRKPTEMEKLPQTSPITPTYHSTKEVCLSSDSRARYLQAKIEAKRAFRNLKQIALEEAGERGDISTFSVLEGQVRDSSSELIDLRKACSLMNENNQLQSAQHVGRKEKTSSTSSEASVEYTNNHPVTLRSSDFEQLPIPKRARGNEHNLLDRGSHGKVSRTSFKRRTANPKTARKLIAKDQTGKDSVTAEVKDLMDNVTNATDILNSLINGDKMDW